VQFTGERSVSPPSGRLYYENLHRYSIAARLAAGKRVLDLASGEGFGTALLARSAADVVGIDPDEDCIARARSSAYHPNLRFLRGEPTNVPLKDESIDVITSFETMQRLWDQEAMLDEFRRVLAAGGMLILSTPNKLVYSDRSGFRNPYHVRELYYADLRDMLARRFPFVRIYGQRIVASSVLHPLAGNAGKSVRPAWYAGDAGGVREELPELPHPLHFIAVCGDDAPEVEIASAFLDPRDDLLEDVQAELETLRARVVGAAPLEIAHERTAAAPLALVAGSAVAAPDETQAGAVAERDPKLQLADMRAWCERQVVMLTESNAAALAAQRAEHARELEDLTAGHEAILETVAAELRERAEELAALGQEAGVLRERCEMFDAFKEQARRDAENVREQIRRERSAAERASLELRERVKQAEHDVALARQELAAEREGAERAGDELALLEQELADERERSRRTETHLHSALERLRARLDDAANEAREASEAQEAQEARPHREAAPDERHAKLDAELALVRAELAEQQRLGAEREVRDARVIHALRADSDLLRSMLGSRSWRYTEPLRRFGQRFRGR
jgi:SAM-dependent methyltransferase